jgi:NADPH-dependent 2,4-dienoyl-CoA reductase/sulfur reductase-like enzyme
MRVADGNTDTMLQFDGREVPARRGESIAAALTAAGIRDLRETRGGAGRGVFCGMGVCQDCVVVVDGELRPACMTEVACAHRIGRGTFPATAPATASLLPVELGDIPVATPEVLVVGAGAGGLSAGAVAAEAGAEVVLLDERARPGGQYFKQPSTPDGMATRDDRQFAAGRALIARAGRAGVRIIEHVEAWGAFAPRDIAALDARGCMIYRPRQLILATGAYERALPVPGWTLPGVMTTGAAQTLLRSYGVAPGRRVLLAGNGPLNLQVAVELARRGIEIVAVAELAARPGAGSLSALVRMAASTPDLLRDGILLACELRRRGIPMRYGHALVGVEQGPAGLIAHLGGGAMYRESREAFTVDAVCMGYGFQPANELARALDCRHAYDPGRGHLVTERDAECATSLDGVYAVGDCCGLGGARAAAEEGLIAGLAAATAAGHAALPALARECAAARRRLWRHRRFQAALWRLFAAPGLQTELATPETLICRCESVTLSEIDAVLADGKPSIGEVKRRTRLGMGNCQGRSCAPLLAAVLAARQGRGLDEFALFAPRAPVKPISIAALSRR